MDNAACENTDREIWREREGDFYADSIHVTKEGGIGIDCGGYVIVMPVREWFATAGGIERLSAALKSQTQQTWQESERADKADHMRVSIETGKVHPALAIDLKEHRQQAYQTGWNDGYAEGFGKGQRAK